MDFHPRSHSNRVRTEHAYSPPLGADLARPVRRVRLPVLPDHRQVSPVPGGRAPGAGCSAAAKGSRFRNYACKK